jgi:molybdate transport system substrate-binding protein
MLSRPKLIFLALLALYTSLFLSACALTSTEDGGKPATLTILAAASLTGAYNDLGARFEQAHPGVNVQFNYAGSQQLAQQLQGGAPADVFASANLKQMEAVVEAGRVAKDDYQTFAKNKLVIVFPKDNPARLEGLDDLAESDLKLILAAQEVPVGQYSLDFLDQAEGTYGPGFKNKVLANVVSYEDNVKSVLTKVALGEADAGIVYTSDVTVADAEKVAQIQIPDGLNVIATYPIAVIRDSSNQELAQLFVELVLSPEGQSVLESYGFIPATSQ